MLHLDRIKSLLDFLRTGDPSLEDILKFVAMDTLYEFSAMKLLFNIVRRDGSVYIPAFYGFEQEHVDLIPERFVSVDTPINRSLRTGVVTECGSSDTFLFAGLGYQDKLFPTGFAFSFAWPIPTVGSVVTFCSKQIEITLADEEFLYVIGEILATQITKMRTDVDLGRGLTPRATPSSIALTPRQWTVLNGIQKGRTNAEIAAELEFSESLIRQETVQIYRKLGVSGRREILGSEVDFLKMRTNKDEDPQI
jgi:DNA-binding CsgD family transcriptional regulator